MNPGHIFTKLLKRYRSVPIVARASLWFVACTMLQKCISFLTVPIFTRIMPTAEYGLYSTYLSWYSILTVFCTLNMHSVIYVNQYTQADTREDKDRVAVPMLSLSMVMTLALFILYLVLYPVVGEMIGMPFPLMCLLFAQILFEPPVNMWTAQQRFEYRYVVLVIRTISMVVLNTVLGIVFVWLSQSNEAVARACSIVLVQIIFGGVFYLYFWKRAHQVFSVKGWRHILQVQLPLLPHSLSLTVLSSSDRIMITRMVGAAQAGIYSVAYSAGFVVNMLKSSIVDALRPWVYQRIKEQDYVSIRKTMNTVMLLITLLSVLFTAFAPEVIFLMAPAQYHEAVRAIPPVAASAFFTFLYNMFSIVGLYYEKTRKIMLASISGALMNIVLNFICIPVFGYIAAAYTTLVSYAFFALAHYLIMRSICRANLNDAQIYDMRFIMLMSAVMFGLALMFTFTFDYLWVRYGIVLVLTVAAYIKRDLFMKTLKDLKKTKKA